MENKETKQPSEKEMNIKFLNQIIYDFENSRWLKMATRNDLATYIVSHGFYPSAKIVHYQKEIEKIVAFIEDLLSQSDNCGLSTLETKKIIKMLKNI